MARAEPIGGGEGGLNVVADDVAAEVKRLAVNPLPVRLVGFAERGIVGRQFRATDCNWEEKFETIFREVAGGLRVRSQARGEAEVVFGRLVGIGDKDGLRDGRRRWLHVQAGAPHAVEHGPAHLPYAVARGLGDEGGLGIVAVTFEGGGQARVDDSKDGLETRAVGFDGEGVGGGRREIARPARGAFRDRLGDRALGEGVGAVHEARRKVGLWPVERRGLGEWGAAGGLSG